MIRGPGGVETFAFTHNAADWLLSSSWGGERQAPSYNSTGSF